jgi:hypothetical protein
LSRLIHRLLIIYRQENDLPIGYKPLIIFHLSCLLPNSVAPNNNNKLYINENYY